MKSEEVLRDEKPEKVKMKSVEVLSDEKLEKVSGGDILDIIQKITDEAMKITRRLC